MSLVFVDLSYCNWCKKNISPSNQKVYLELNNNGNPRNVMHMSCWAKKDKVLKRRTQRIKNPVGRYGAKTGG